MGNKNDHRYKVRKHMNTIKHEQKSLFDEPPVLISTWDELGKLENDTHRIEVDLDGGSGYVVPKFELTSDDDYYLHNRYLSTHIL